MTDGRPAIVAAVSVHNGRVVLVRRRVAEGSLSWQFPAGEQEPGETAFQTATREVAEEIGLVVTPVLMIGERQHPVTGRHLIYVGCRASSDTARVVDTEELAELAWCDWPAVLDKVPSGMFEPISAYLAQQLA